MTSKLPLKAINGSNIGRPGGIPRPSGLKPPSSGLKTPSAAGLSGLKPPTSSIAMKRPASSSPPNYEAVQQVSKKLRPDTKSNVSTLKPSLRKPAPKVATTARPATRPATRPVAPVSRTAPPKPAARPAPMTRQMSSSRLGAAKPPTRAPAKPAASGGATGAGAAGKKRAAWDYKGRVEDLEAMVQDFQSVNQRTASRVEQLELERFQLQGEVQVKEKVSAQATQQITELQTKLRLLEDETSSTRRAMQQQISDLEFTKSSIERQRDTLDGDLRATQQEVSGLKGTVASLTAANAGTKAELEATQINLTQSLESGRIKDALIVELRATIAAHEASIAEHEANSREYETERRYLHNTIQELKGNIRVFCRVRPLLGDERLGNDGEITHMNFPDQKVLELEKVGELAANETLSGLARNGKKYEFGFDRVFGPQDGQAVVFDEISQLVQSALDGYNVCIFAYGQTGSGKTFTMEGPDDKNQENQGMIPRAVEQVFKTADSLRDKGWKYEFQGSFLEIYNETIRDLLGNGSTEMKHDIKMVSKDTNEVMVTNLTVVPVTNEDQVHHLLQKAAQNRAVAETKCNERSSRSHSVFQIKISGHNDITEEKSVGMLNLIDLAGSERLKESGSQGQRLKETQAINKSLANLGNVIMALANKDPHIPYRNSKLTHLLQNSLGGNSKTLMFVNVNPREDFIGETLCSLRFATKVNACNIGTAQKRQK